MIHVKPRWSKRLEPFRRYGRPPLLQLLHLLWRKPRPTTYIHTYIQNDAESLTCLKIFTTHKITLHLFFPSTGRTARKFNFRLCLVTVSNGNPTFLHLRPGQALCFATSHRPTSEASGYCEGSYGVIYIHFCK